MSCESDKSCSQDSHSHSHSHGGQHCGSCCNHHCQCGCHQQKPYCEQLLELADEAWMELVKDKIKEAILQHSGEHLTKLAQLVSKTNHQRWADKLDEKKNEQDFDNQLKDLMYCQKQKK